MRSLAPVALLILAGCGAAAAEREPDPGWTRHRDGLHGLTVSFPSDWHRAPRSLTPSLLDPRERLSLATFPLRRRPNGRCGHLPVGALRAMGPRDAFVTVQERRSPAGLAAGSPRLGDAAPGDVAACTGTDVREHWSEWGTRGRGGYVLAAFGPDAPARRRRAVERILASLELDRPQRRGVLQVLPPDGWRVVREPLTGFSELAVASYPVPAGPPDRNCTPRRAVDALPVDGGLLYVTEQADARPPTGRPTGARLLRRPERSYECRGISRIAHWRERGRSLSANLYLGPQAPPRRRRELAQVFDSLVVRE